MQRVLVVDGSSAQKLGLCANMAAHGLEVHRARSGRQALQRIGEWRPDLILLNLEPEVDGFAMLEAMQLSTMAQQFHVLTIVVHFDRVVLRRALEMGADDYITMPFTADEVVRRVAIHLRLLSANQLLERRRRDGEILDQIGQQISSQLDIQSILQNVTRMVADVLDTDRCSVILIDPEDTLSARVVAASDDMGLTDHPIVLAEYPEVRQVVETHQSLVLADISADPVVATVKDQLARLDVRSAALFPLMEGGHCFGVFFLRSTRPREAFSTREIQFGQIVANTIAVAITNARLFAELKEETDRISHARVVVEQRLRAVERYADFFENAADAIFIVDSSGRILFLNRMAEDLVGPRETITGKPLSEAYQVVDPSQIEALFERLRAGDFSHRIDLQTRDLRTLSISAARVPNDAAFSVTTREVTEQRHNEQMAAVAALAGATAHELNQPLTSVLGYAELLSKRICDDDPSLGKAVRIIRQQAERMASIVRRIGQITRYETKPYVGGARIIDLEAATAAPARRGPVGEDSK